jgi:predicted outer membrane repeat protein
MNAAVSWKPALAMVTILSVLVGPATADVIYVRPAANGSSTGASWSDAFTRLDEALAVAIDGDEVWVARGRYTPADSTSSFVIPAGVAVYGGFIGGEVVREERRPAVHPTVLSGDINNDDSTEPSPLGWPYTVRLNTANAGHVVAIGGPGAPATLDGFRIERGAYGPPGTPSGDPLLYGSGLYCVGASVIVNDCDFADNLASFGHGGGAFLWDADAAFIDCTFDHNLAYQGSGGAIFAGGDSSLVVSDSTFTSNLTVSTHGQTGQGGAIQLATSLPATIERCVFSANAARPFYAGSYEIPRGGAISSFCLADPTTVIRGCVFRSNQAAYGAAIMLWNPATIENCAISGNTAFAYDSGSVTQGGRGAGIMAQWTSVDITNCTIANNTGREHVGVALVETLPNFPADGLLLNSIVWGNVALGEDVSPRKTGVAGTYEAENACIQLLFTADPGEDPIDPDKYPGCTENNPMLTNAPGGNVHLLAASPCIDTGENAFVPPGMTLDLDGHARIFRGLPGPGAAIVDMGAFEFDAAWPCTPTVEIETSATITCAGAPATLAVSTMGTGPFTYQWRRNGANLPGSSTSITAIDPGVYDCLVTNACGNTTSNAITLADGGAGCGTCPSDVNGDGDSDILDFLDFIDAFGACENQPAPCAGSSGVDADFNGDTLVDILDFLDFFDAFGIGCD